MELFCFKPGSRCAGSAGPASVCLNLLSARITGVSHHARCWAQVFKSALRGLKCAPKGGGKPVKTDAPDPASASWELGECRALAVNVVITSVFSFLTAFTGMCRELGCVSHFSELHLPRLF